MLTTLIIAVLIGLIPAAIAKGKGESFGLCGSTAQHFSLSRCPMR
jgi:hypothetical protein